MTLGRCVTNHFPPSSASWLACILPQPPHANVGVFRSAERDDKRLRAHFYPRGALTERPPRGPLNVCQTRRAKVRLAGPAYQKQRLASNNFTLRAAIRTRVHVTLAGMIAESRDTLRAPATHPSPASPARDSALSQSLKAGTGEREKMKKTNNSGNARRYSFHIFFFLFIYFLTTTTTTTRNEESEKDKNCQFRSLSGPYFTYINRDQ